MHTPPTTDFYKNAFHENWKPEPLKRLEALLTAHNVKAILCGHFHRDEVHFLGSIPLYVSPSVAGNWGRQASYRLYEYHDGKLGYLTQYDEPEN